MNVIVYRYNINCMNEEKMKKIEIEMSLLMGASVGLVLTLVGLLSAGQFTFPRFIMSFLISFVISQIISRIIPIRKITDDVCNKFQLPLGSIKQRLMETFISDLFFSPIMTFIMVYLAYRQATAPGINIPFGPMLLKSEVISFIAAYILIFFLMPVFKKLVFKRNGIDLGGPKPE